MDFFPTDLPGVVRVRPRIFPDDRGFFLETYHRDKYAAGGIDAVFVQDNHSRSARGTVRGLHGQTRKPQGKLVRCIEGEIFDVAVDIRRGSPTFGRWVGATLSAENFEQLYVPPDFLHGFCVTSEVAQVEYKCTDVYDPGHELTVRWDDPAIGIEWPVEAPLLSARDASAPLLNEVEAHLPSIGESGS
ncbi:MAG: dTDP-4-dehydrorhamnose 3,5-epimerase [Acidobacteriota bacterium]